MALDITNMSSSVGELQRDYLYFIQFIPKTNTEGLASIANVPTSAISGNQVLTATVQALYTDAITALGTIGLQIDAYNMKAVIPPRKTNEIAIQYCGQTKYYSGTDGSSKSTTLEFLQDEKGIVYNFFNKLQQLSGDELTHSAAYEFMQNFDIGVAEVSVTKKTITLYKKLINVKIMGIEATQPNKEGNGVGRVTVPIVWDLSKTVESFHGKLIATM